MDSSASTRFQLQQETPDVQTTIELSQPLIPDSERVTTERNISRKHFSTEEDKYIIKWIEENGASNWQALALELPGRNARQVRDRYRYYLCPDVVSREWTKEEDEILISLVLTCGHKWAQFSKIFNGRSDCDVKNHWHKIERLAKRPSYKSATEQSATISAQVAAEIATPKE